MRCRRTRTGRWRTETAYAVTSLAAEQADPAELADAIRGHWHVENRLHPTRADPAPSDIRTGYPGQPAAALYLRGRHHYWLHTTAYYTCLPWPQLLIAAMERWASAPERYPQRRLPVPELGRIDPDTGFAWLAHPRLDPTGTLLHRYARARQLLRQPGA